MRSEQEIFDDLARLCTSTGFIHALASLTARDNIVIANQERMIEASSSGPFSERLIRTELSTLIGLMMRAPISFSLPPPHVVSFHFERSQELLRELHQAMVPPDTQDVLENAAEDPGSNPFASGPFLREPIFYAAESAYPFQYRDLAPRKYAADSQWLRDNKQIDLDVGHAVCRALPDLLKQSYLSELRGLKKKPVEQWTLLPGFVLSSTGLASHIAQPVSKVRAFVEAFTLPSGERNEGFTSLNSFNLAYAYPFIRRGPDEFVLLQYQGAMAAFYETPFYWMCEDESYAEATSGHRGEFAEAFSADRLTQVFGRERVFQNVELRRSRKETLGEIDVLVTFGDRLIVAQAKSKKLTLKARAGEDRQLREDFDRAVQDAVDQSFSCAESLLDPTVTLQTPDGSPVSLAHRPSAIFPVTILTDHYPALSFQSRQFLTATTTEEILTPIVTDVFALDAMTEMLSSPLRLLSYLSLRSRFDRGFFADHELDLLAFHLRRNLWLPNDIDLMRVEGDSDLYRAMAARRDDVPGPRSPEGILTLFQGTPFADILTQIDDRPIPLAIDLGLFFLEQNEATVRKINEELEKIVQGAAADGTPYRFALGVGRRGPALTAHCNRLPRERAEALLQADCRRALDRADCSFGISLDPDGTLRTVGKLVRDAQDL